MDETHNLWWVRNSPSLLNQERERERGEREEGEREGTEMLPSFFLTQLFCLSTDLLQSFFGDFLGIYF